MNSYEKIIKKFWDYFDEGKYDEGIKLMSSDVIIRWCNTREIFNGRDNFLNVYNKYPGQNWSIKLEKMISKDKVVITVVKAECKEPEMSFYATSFFKFVDGLIKEVDEYWGDNGEPPKWRIEERLSERY